MAASVTIQGKFFLRDLTVDTKDWDAPLPTDREAEWEAWRQSLQDLPQFEMPRVYSVFTWHLALSLWHKGKKFIFFHMLPQRQLQQ